MLFHKTGRRLCRNPGRELFVRPDHQKPEAEPATPEDALISASSCFPMSPPSFPLWRTTETVPWWPPSQPPPSFSIPQQSMMGTNLHRGAADPLPPPPCEKFSHDFQTTQRHILHGENTEMLINCTSAVNQNEFSKWLFSFFCPAYIECFPTSLGAITIQMFKPPKQTLAPPIALQPISKETRAPHLVSAELKIFLRF